MTALVADPGLAAQILTEHREGLADAQSAIHHARLAGELLLHAREQCGRGEWLPWLMAHCPEIPERTASRYMQIARCPELEAESVREAILKLASPRKPNNSPRVADSTEPAPAHGQPPAQAIGTPNAAAIGQPTAAPAGSPVSESAADDDGSLEPERLTDQEMLEQIELDEREYQASIQRVMEADDTLSAAHAEIKRQAAEIAALKSSRDGFMSGKLAIVELLKAEQRKTERQSKLIDHLRAEIEQLKAAPQESAEADALRKQVERLTAENEKLRERIAIMEESA